MVMYKSLLICVLALTIPIKLIDGLECFSCSNVRNMSDCHTTRSCTGDEQCFTTTTGQGPNTIFNLGCRNVQQCSTTSSTVLPVNSIVGRSTNDAPSACSQCCASDSCNKKICNQAIAVITDPNGVCKDDADYNCELISGAFNVCGDIHHAKTFCRRWCGLCDLVDGGWSNWNAWGQCGVTCGAGHMARSRTCTNPTPAHRGLDCIGDASETSPCNLGSCPVHGVWSLWSSWSSCTVTCGGGLERRDRTCSRPTPGSQGNHCFGDAHDDRVCLLKGCIDGNWSTWGAWSTCTATCNGGLKVKHRKCNNPAPSVLGEMCEGNYQVSETCNSRSCPIPTVYFTVTTPNNHLINTRLIFTVTVDNVGGGYNITSAQFTCPVAGLYQFSFSFLARGSSGNTFCNLRKNSQTISYVYVDLTITAKSTSGTVHIALSVGDVFDVGDCNNWGNVVPQQSGMFTGALIHPL